MKIYLDVKINNNLTLLKKENLRWHFFQKLPKNWPYSNLNFLPNFKEMAIDKFLILTKSQQGIKSSFSQFLKKWQGHSGRFYLKKFITKPCWNNFGNFLEFFRNSFDSLRPRNHKTIAICFPLRRRRNAFRTLPNQRKCVKIVPHDWLQLQLSKHVVASYRYQLITVANP